MKIFKITALLITLFAFSLTRLSANPAIIADVLREMGADFTLSHAEIERRFNSTELAEKLTATEPEAAIIEALYKAEEKYQASLDEALQLLSAAFLKDRAPANTIGLALSIVKPKIQMKNKIIAADFSKKSAALIQYHYTLLTKLFPKKHVTPQIARSFTLKIIFSEITEALAKETEEKIRLAKYLCTEGKDQEYIKKYGVPFCLHVARFKIDDLIKCIEKVFLDEK